MSKYYTEDHEWVSVDGETAIVGISVYAAKQLGDVVFVEVPDVDAEFAKGDEAAVVESVKAASEVYAPISGTIIEGNPALEDAPETVNASPEADGWFFKMTIADKGELDGMMSEADYKTYCENL